jgi:hypothetical protein
MLIPDKNNLIKKKKSPLLAKIKFEPTFFHALWRFAFLPPFLGEIGGKGWGGEFHPMSLSMKSVWIFSNIYRQSVKVLAGSPAMWTCQLILNREN